MPCHFGHEDTPARKLAPGRLPQPACLTAALAAARQRLEAANARYEHWSADTRAIRDAAGKATPELQRRGGPNQTANQIPNRRMNRS